MLGNGVGWSPEQYVQGNYFQHKINESFRKSFNVEFFGSILDIGSGDGQYSSLLADNVQRGSILGIDNSTEMVMHARNNWARENLSFEVQNIEEFQQSETFDFILSFWCLHWTNINASFFNIFNSLKSGGKMYAVFSSFSDNSILQSWQELAKQSRYKDLTERYFNVIRPNNGFFYDVINTLYRLAFSQVKLNLKTTLIYLPNIDHFRNLLLNMPFTKTMSSEIIEALINEFQSICQRKYGGKLYYETRPIFLEAIK